MNFSCRSLVLLVLGHLLLAADPWPTSAGIIGGAEEDAIAGTGILSDGHLLLDGRISGPLPVTPTLVAGAAADSSHVLLKLAPHGRSVVAAARLPALSGAFGTNPNTSELVRLAVDGADRIWVGTGSGLYCLNADLTLRWQRTVEPGRFVCADGAYGAYEGMSGVVVLRSDDGSAVVTAPGFSHPDGTGGLLRSLAIDAVNQLVFTGGFRQALGNGIDVQIPWLRAQRFSDGAQVWMDYNWTGDQAYSGNQGMADTRTVQLCIGEDRKLYAGFHVEGGNTFLNFQPRDLTISAGVVGGDMYQQFANSHAEIKTAIGRYDPATGNLLKMQYLTGRSGTSGLPSARRFSITSGAMAAAADGTVYLAGDVSARTDLISHFELINPATGNVCTLDASFNVIDSVTLAIVTNAVVTEVHTVPTGTTLPYGSDLTSTAAGAYGGGGVLVVLSPDFTTRQVCTRLVTGKAPSGERDGLTSALRSVAVRGGWVVVAGTYAPEAGSEGVWQSSPLGTSAGTLPDAYYAVRAPSSGNSAPGIVSVSATPAQLSLP